MFLKMWSESNLIAKSGWDYHLRSVLSKGPVGAVVTVPDTHPLGTPGGGSASASAPPLTPGGGQAGGLD